MACVCAIGPVPYQLIEEEKHFNLSVIKFY